MHYASCAALHEWARTLPRHHFSFDEEAIPKNGIYLLFEQGEEGHDGERLVRVGTHTGEDQLRSRLRQHFLTENKDRSIFRKNIGRALLNRAKDPYLAVWEVDMTPAIARKTHGRLVDADKQQAIEKEVTGYMRNSFSFVVVRIGEKKERLALESKLIGTLSQCKMCHASPGWLGRSSPVGKIRESGLWQVQGLGGEPLLAEDFVYLQHI